MVPREARVQAPTSRRPPPAAKHLKGQPSSRRKSYAESEDFDRKAAEQISLQGICSAVLPVESLRFLEEGLPPADKNPSLSRRNPSFFGRKNTARRRDKPQRSGYTCNSDCCVVRLRRTASRCAGAGLNISSIFVGFLLLFAGERSRMYVSSSGQYFLFCAAPTRSSLCSIPPSARVAPWRLARAVARPDAR